jgi:hypothetical protein
VEKWAVTVDNLGYNKKGLGGKDENASVYVFIAFYPEGCAQFIQNESPF